MLERHMEELIAAHPDDFFPRHVLRLCGRQQTFKGVGRFDLHFLDQFDTNILMELKAVPARYEDASQLAKYRDAMQARGDERIIMWLVAPLIPPSVREFLAHIGIEFTEIHESEFKRVAALREVNIDEKPAVKQHLLAPLDLDKASTRPVTRDEKGTSAPGIAWHFNTDESEVPGSTARMIERSCFALWGYKDTERKMNVPTEGEPYSSTEARSESLLRVSLANSLQSPATRSSASKMSKNFGATSENSSASITQKPLQPQSYVHLVSKVHCWAVFADDTLPR